MIARDVSFRYEVIFVTMSIWLFNEMKMIKWRPKSDCVAPPYALETVRGRKETGYKDRIYMGVHRTR